jgi:aspartate-semialdehyde dehydrogenase
VTRVAIVGATGAVGAEFLRVLAERAFPADELRLVASERSAGRRLTFRGEEHEVIALRPGALDGIDVAFYSAGAGTSRETAPGAAEAGALVVDNSSAFRMDPEVPLVVPEANAHAVAGHRGIVANPNCSTILAAVVLAPLHREVGIRRVVAATYQAVSGAGARALAEMEGQRVAAAEETPGDAGDLPAPIDLNVLPVIGPLDGRGSSEEELKMGRELRKILEAPDLRASVTCVRVPVRRAHSEAIHLELARELSAADAEAILREAPGVRLVEPDRATPLEAAGRDEVLVSRLRNEPDRKDVLVLWLTGDQLRKGAALNAVQIAEHVLANERP